MKAKWWERPVWILADFWWAFLIGIVIILGAFLTRCYWAPSICLESPVGTNVEENQQIEYGDDTPTETEGNITKVSATEIPITATLTPSQEQYGYINTKGNYGFNYPITWTGEENEKSVKFTSDIAEVRVDVLPLETDETIETIKKTHQDEGIGEVSEATVDNLPALRINVMDDQVVLSSIYVLIHGEDKMYLIYRVKKDDIDSLAGQNSYNEFEDMVKSFRIVEN